MNTKYQIPNPNIQFQMSNVKKLAHLRWEYLFLAYYLLTFVFIHFNIEFICLKNYL
jgi:hypothetical protein